MARELTEQARANLAAGNDYGPGTNVCAGCSGPKEESRLNSARCKACGTGKIGASASTSPVRIIRAVLSVDVAERFAAEAAEHGMQPNNYLAHLINRRDDKRQNRTTS